VIGPQAVVVATDVKLLAPDEASDQPLIDELVRIVNGAYAVGEDGLWLAGTTRIGPGEIADAIRSGGMLAASREGRLVGCAYVRPLDAGAADLGLISVAPDEWGGGIGRELVRSAEELMRSHGLTTMQLELLVPKGWVHPAKDRLRSWYTRLGYRMIRSVPFDEVAAPPASQLATPCEFLVFRKSLAAAPAAGPATPA
jgi:GNAT superfamily N-acetyltransferase